MHERKIPKNLDFGINVTLDIISGKWKPCLTMMINDGFRRPNELQRLIPLASRKVLNQHLKELEEHSIIKKIIYHELPPKVEYFVTDLGYSLLPIIAMMENWGQVYIELQKNDEK